MLYRLPTFLLLMLALMCLFSRGALAETPAPLAPAPSASYRLQAGDEISLTVFPRPEYGSAGIIPPDGLFPLKNTPGVQAAGLTAAELAERARKALETILKNPRVTVTLVKLGSPPPGPRVTVIGAITKPGPLPLEEGLRLLKAVELSGGTTMDADLARVLLRHKDLKQEVLDFSNPENATDIARNRLLQDGDSIEVPSKLRVRVTVSGAVTKPGPLDTLEPGTRVAKALDSAGGALKEADLTKVSVVRDDLTRVTIDLSTPERLTDAGHNLTLRNGDSIEVPLLFRGGFVSISGEVTKAGSYPLMPGMALEDLIIAAEKMTLVADLERIELVRANGVKESINLPVRLQQGAAGRVALADGDQVIVPRAASMVILVGAVPTPGPRPLKPGQNLQEFFTMGQPETLAGLDDAKIDLKAVQLIRRGQPARKIDLKAVLKGQKSASNIPLQTGDVIFLPSRQESNRSGLDYLRALPFIGSLLTFF